MEDEELINLWRGKGIKIIFPQTERYGGIADLLRERGFILEEKNGFWVAEFPTEFGIHISHTNLSAEDFQQFYRDLKVENGFKSKDGEYVIFVRPKRPRLAFFRVSEAEYAIMKFAAEKIYKTDFSRWLRMVTERRALKAIAGELERRKKLKKLGLSQSLEGST